ncbi:hypothetical protein K0038_03631 [Pseudomonas syringae]|nr:hypothetical protein [Pseudomonas syringae]
MSAKTSGLSTSEPCANALARKPITQSSWTSPLLQGHRNPGTQRHGGHAVGADLSAKTSVLSTSESCANALARKPITQSSWTSPLLPGAQEHRTTGAQRHGGHAVGADLSAKTSVLSTSESCANALARKPIAQSSWTSPLLQGHRNSEARRACCRSGLVREEVSLVDI